MNAPLDKNPPHWEEKIFWPTLALLALAVLVTRLPGFNPPSLWYDDAWVALAGKASNPIDLFYHTRSTPIGFTFLTALFIKMVPDPEIAAQLPALLFSIALLPLGALIVRRADGNLWIALLAAVFLACSPTIALYSVRVKQFTCDAFASLLVLWLAMPLLQKNSPTRAFRNLAIAGGLLTLFSHVSFFVSFVTVNTLLLVYLYEHRLKLGACRERLAWAGVFNGFFALMFVLFYSRQRHGKLVDSWEDKVAFIPFGSKWAVMRDYWVDGVLGKTVYGAFEIIELVPPYAWVVLLLTAAGLLALAAQSATRLLAVIFALIFAQALVLSSLRLYPLGWGRVDIYLHTLVLLLAAFGCGVILRPLLNFPWFSRLCPLLLAAVFLWRAPGVGQKAVSYHEFDDNLEYLQKAEAEWKSLPGSILILNQDGTYLAAYYNMDWNLQIERKKLARGVEILSRDPDLIIPSEPDGYRDNLSSLDDNLLEIAELKSKKIVILHVKEVKNVTLHMRDFFLQHGYRQGAEILHPGIFLTVLEK
jgi:hypothetical protein